MPHWVKDIFLGVKPVWNP